MSATTAVVLAPPLGFVRRFCHNRVALASLVVLAVIVLVAIFAPAFAPHNPTRS